METAKSADFFLGANSPNGFSSYFTEINDPKLTDNCYVIKGCPGSGKSTMMKTIAERLSEQESFIENIHCSSDPDSLDGVILHDSRERSLRMGHRPMPLNPNCRLRMKRL